MIANDILYAESEKGIANPIDDARQQAGKFKHKSATALGGLSHLQKILLVTDGTVTALLEHLSGEPIMIEKLQQSTALSADDIPDNHRQEIEPDGYPALVRKILLKGESSGTNYIYAESSVLLNSLPEKFRDDLVNTNMPIGKLWSKHKFETYKTNFTIKRERATKILAELLSVAAGSEILSRTYCVYTCGRKSMVITEKFSGSCFSDKN